MGCVGVEIHFASQTHLDALGRDVGLQPRAECACPSLRGKIERFKAICIDGCCGLARLTAA
jgi:hypothetical protein